MYLTPFSRTLFIVLLCILFVLYGPEISCQLICSGSLILGKCIIYFIRYILEIFPEYFGMCMDSFNASDNC